MKWISVKDKLPESPYARKLIWVSRDDGGNHYIELGVYRDGRWDYPGANGWHRVVYWHELPDLPNEPPKQP